MKYGFEVLAAGSGRRRCGLVGVMAAAALLFAPAVAIAQGHKSVSRFANAGGQRSGAGCTRQGAQPLNEKRGDDNYFAGVAATGCTAWAVGQYSNDRWFRTLIERWNGKAWRIQSSPNPGASANFAYDYLSAASATSSSDAWAVGAYATSANAPTQTLIEHWDGTGWQVIPGPSPSGGSLGGVSATSSTDAWAVGSDDNAQGGTQTLIEHWDGTTWQVIPSPNPGPGGANGYNELGAVSAISSTDAWAVGDYDNAHDNAFPLIEHWDGTSWQVVPSPSPATTSFDQLNGVSASSPTNVWAVGAYQKSGVGHTLIEHWDGTSWQIQSSPNPGFAPSLASVAATSSGDAWAVGSDGTQPQGQGFIAHWNGTAWKTQTKTTSSDDIALLGVSATSSTTAWTVGGSGYSPARPYALYWNGQSWK